MLDDPLFYFAGDPGSGPGAAPWTYGDAFQGTQILGGTGSGKTSTSGRRFAVALLRAHADDPSRRFGGLVLTAKDEELGLWARPAAGEVPAGHLAAAHRPPATAIAFGPRTDLYREFGLGFAESGPAFNFLRYERELYRRLKFPATPNLVATLLTAMGGGHDRRSASEPYWDEALRQLLTNAIDLLDIAGKPLSLDAINEVILTAPQSAEEMKSSRWRDQCCATLLREASALQEFEPGREEDLRATIWFWAHEFPHLADRTRSSVVSTFTSKASALLRSPFRRMFSGDSTITPDDTLAGQVVILDLPVKTYGEAGRLAQVIFKTVWQKATEWRWRMEVADNPVFLWADEAQYFVTDHDVAFQQTARTNRAATVYLTQNLPNYHAAFGGSSARARTDSLLGCLQTKVFHANGDVVTNEWAERLFGYKDKMKATFGASHADRGPQHKSREPAATQTEGFQPTRLPRVSAHEFAMLTTAGPSRPATAWIFVLGKRWSPDEEGLARFEVFSRTPESDPGVFPP